MKFQYDFGNKHERTNFQEEQMAASALILA
jgi:hypothetical protein